MQAEEEWRSVTRSLAVDHPAGPGHFPGNPIVPGAVLLDEIVQAIAGAYNLAEGEGEIPNAKFLHPIRPGDKIEIRWRIVAPREVKFECLQAGKKALSGLLRLKAREG